MTFQLRWSALLLMAGCLAAAGCSQPGFWSKSKPAAAWPAANNSQQLTLSNAPPPKANWTGRVSPFGNNAAGSAPAGHDNSSSFAGSRGRNQSDEQRQKSDERGQLAFARLTERRGQLKESEQMYRSILERNPRQSEAHHRMGILASQRGAFDEAEEHFRIAQSLMPLNVELLNDMGYLCFLQHRLDEAGKLLQQALEQEPNHAAAANNLGLVLGEQGRFREALVMFKRVGNESQAFANMAYLYTQVGDFEQAQACYSRALTLDSSMRPAADAMIQVAQHQKYMSSAPPATNAEPNAGPQSLAISDASSSEAKPARATVDVAQAGGVVNVSWVDRSRDDLVEIIDLDENHPRPRPQLGAIRLESAPPAESRAAPSLLAAPPATPIAQRVAPIVSPRYASQRESSSTTAKPAPLQIAMLDIRDPGTRSTDNAATAPAAETSTGLSPVTKAFFVQRDGTPPK
jgi:Tfp pilus assembly protein PilF